MQTQEQFRPSPAPSGFAGVLAAIAKPPTETAESPPTWNGDDLGDEAIPLSYERALRAHARYRPTDTEAWRAIPTAGMEPEQPAEEEAALRATCAEEAIPEASAAAQAATDRDLRLASVTIRLSKAESERLRQRAAEAGVTVSAYLRSCTFEAEALRAQVKEALVAMRAAARESQGVSEPGRQGVQLARVLGHIGKLWIGLSAGRAS